MNLTKITKFFLSRKYTKRIIENIAFRLRMINTYSFNTNLVYASRISIVFCILFLLVTVYFIFMKVIWYLLLIYLFLFFAFFLLLLAILDSFMKFRFLSELPSTFKLLSSRLITEPNIVRAIKKILDNIKGPLNREFRRIYETLLKNDTDEIRFLFKNLKEAYNDEHFILLINLIEQAHFRGAVDEIKIQLEKTTEDILIDIENAKDLATISRTYMVFSVISTPILIYYIEVFSNKAMGDGVNMFFKSFEGIGLKILIFITVILYAFTLYHFEKTNV